MLDIKRVIASAPRKPEQVELQPLTTPWSENAISEEGVGTNHPHPQFEREHFHSLNGRWHYCIIPSENAEEAWRTATIPTEWNGEIIAPFSPEAPLSGVNRQLKPSELLWYKKTFPFPLELNMSDKAATGHESAGKRCILHFEAVDYACTCYCNGIRVGSHTGGYLPFSFDITDTLSSDENEIALCVYDPSDKGVQLRGKQKLERGGIWYTAQSGIWQTVWYEIVPEDRIESLKIDAQVDEGQLTITVTTGTCVEKSCATDETHVEVKLFDKGELVNRALSATIHKSTCSSPAPNPPSTPGSIETERLTHTHTLVLDVIEPHLWSPKDPHLYQIELTYGSDKITSYCAFRTITVEEDEHGIKRLHLNHKPIFLRGVLDQGYWPDGLMTAPSDEALIFDIEAMKRLGFNTLRKHIKIESDRWYYHCDRLGMLVWQDMVCGGSPLSPWHTSRKPTLFRWTWGRFNDAARHYRALSSESAAFRKEWAETCAATIDYLGNHPSIITWVLFNEAWGQFEACKATDMVRALDPTRPIDAVSGWYDQACGDLLSVHNYFRPLEVYKDTAKPQRAFVISEFGGLSFHLPKHSSLASSYGYETYSDIDSFRAAVQKTLATADALEPQGLAGFVYTQLSDIEEETNGILTYDRRINKLEKEDRL